MAIIDGVDYGNLTDAQAHVCASVDAYRDGILYDKFVYDNKQWDSDESSRANINGACTIAILNGGNLPDGFVWRDYNNNNWPVTSTYMGGMAAACATFTFSCYEAAWTHKAAVLAMTDDSQIVDVINYDYSAGWPDTNITP